MMTRQAAAETDRAMGELLRDARLVAGYTQKQLSQKAGISYQQIQKYEAGTNRVSVSRLFDLCHLLNVSPVELISKLGDLIACIEKGIVPRHTPMGLLKTRTGYRLISKLSQIDDMELLNAVTTLVDAIERKKTKS